jgi:hypothetical protein
MDNSIILIANTPIIINELDNGLSSILTKIINWFELIQNYGALLDNDTLFVKFNLDDTYFTQEMRLASMGREYKNWKILPKIFHESGESWDYKKLVLTSNSGLVEWYCKKLNLTIDEYIQVCDNDTIKILGVFYHRMKIIIENINKIFDFLSGKKIYNLFDISCVEKLLSRQDFKIRNYEQYEMCIKIKEYQLLQEELTLKYLNLEKAIELSQMALFNYIRDKTFI